MAPFNFQGDSTIFRKVYVIGIQNSFGGVEELFMIPSKESKRMTTEEADKLNAELNESYKKW